MFQEEEVKLQQSDYFDREGFDQSMSEDFEKILDEQQHQEGEQVEFKRKEAPPA